MKRFLLPVLGWTMAISQLFAQNQLPPSVQAYGDDFSPSVRKSLAMAGIEWDFSQSKQDENVISPRTTILQLDSTVTYHNYVNGDSLPFARTRHTYPESTVEVVHDLLFDVDHWIFAYRTTILTDVLGRRTDIITLAYDEANNTYVNESRLQVFPHDNSMVLIDSFIVSVWNTDTETWEPQLSNKNTFHEDRLLVSDTEFGLFQVPITFRDRYSYDENGLLTSIDSYTVDAGEEFPAGREEFQYTNGLLEKATSYTTDGVGGFLPETRIDYTYTTEGLEELVNSFLYDFEKQDWSLFRVDGYVYDNESRVLSAELVTLGENGIESRTKADFAYEQDELLSIETNFVYDNNLEDWSVVDRKFYYYTNLVAVDPLEPLTGDLFLYPNPTTGPVQIQLTGKMKVHVYTMSGTRVRSFDMAAGERILDLGFLPAGMYQVRATVDGDYFSSKLIIQ